jgi:hypothetical protein
MKELGVIPNTKSVESSVEIESNKTQQKNNKNTTKITATRSNLIRRQNRAK